MGIASHLLLTLAVAAAGVQALPARSLPEYDESARPDRPGRPPFEVKGSDRALLRPGAEIRIHERLGVPTFLWAAPRGAGHGRALSSSGTGTPEQAARAHLGEYAHLYGLDPADVQGAPVASVHDTGRGGIIVTLQQRVGGLEVFRDEMKVLMTRDHELIALSGFIRGEGPGRGRRLGFELDADEALLRALADYVSPRAAGLDARHVRRLGPRPGGHEAFEMDRAALRALGLTMPEPARAKPVLFDLPEGYEPGWYVELNVGPAGSPDSDYFAWVVSALDGRILFRHDLTASDSFSYRVWAESTGLRIPLEGPQGSGAAPHPNGVPDGYQAPFTSPSLVTLQNGPISTNDPWLAPGSTQTSGNNADAYADIAAPDGFTAGDFRASTTSAGVFDRTYNTAQAPAVNQTQQMAAITQLFYDVNFLHDWFYDAGFDEVSRNAQTNNFGRGGIQGDSLRAEAQDSSGRNNANMSTPADGGRPRMQMYVWDGNGPRSLTIDSPAPIAGTYDVGTAAFGPTAFNTTADIVRALDGVGTTTDGCEAITSAVSGRIAFIDRGTCSFILKVQNAQAAGAVGVLIANVDTSPSPEVPPGMGGTGSVAIGSLSLNLADGNLIRSQLDGGAVHGTLLRATAVDRDGTIDNQIVAHEWGHYISNRLVGNSSGLTNNQGGGLGEGWGDFHAMLMTVREEDAAVPATPGYAGAYALAAYVASGGGNDGYYFGIRRYPYSIDFAKNPLTLRHIGDGAPLPPGPPSQFGSSGTTNSEVHNAGEVWTSMLWECYASLLRAGGPGPMLTFQEKQDRMIDYLVAAYKMTPNAPTFVEARDAILSAALAGDLQDYLRFAQAFARRGAGARAVAPPRTSTANQGVVESFQPAADLFFSGAVLDDSAAPCDNDGVLDDGETGHLSITLENIGSIALNSTSVTVSTTNPTVSFPAGSMVPVPAMSPGAIRTVTLDVAMTGATGPQQIDFQISILDPGFTIPGPAIRSSSHRGNLDDRANDSTGDDVESPATGWTFGGNPSAIAGRWRRDGTAYSHTWRGLDPDAVSDQWLVSPVLNVAPTGSFSFTFRHRHIFEFTTVPSLTLFDGGVIEISTNGGSSWTDIGAFASPGYTGVLATGGSNPLEGRSAYAQVSPGFPSFQTVTVSLGTAYQGQNVMVRFRVGSDVNADEYGWEIDDILFNNVTNLPFHALVTDDGICPDADFDGVNDFADCAPANPAAWGAPSEPLDLDVTGGISASLVWAPPAAPGGTIVSYDTLRSSTGSDFGSAVCVETGGTDLSAGDSAPPAPSEIFFYLVRSENVCGSSLGAASDGTPRTGVNCP